MPQLLYYINLHKIMKKVLSLFYIAVFVTTLTSCSNDIDDTIQVKLVQKIIEVNEDKTSSTLNFTYDGTKISSIESEEFIKTFIYTGNLITKIIEVNKKTQTQTTFDYNYTNDLLTKVISSDNHTLNYTHEADGTITFEKTTTDTNNNTIVLWRGTLSLNTNNVIENNKTLEPSGTNVLEKEEFNFGYDTRSNPLRNIVGFNKLLDHSNMISKNNVTSILEINSTKYLDSEEEVSSAFVIKKQYTYDKQGYPKEAISTKPVFGNDNPNHLKSLYFYE
jgi:hypothetical protein